MDKNFNCVRNMSGYGPSPIPQEGKWDQTKEITQISAFSKTESSKRHWLRPLVALG